MAPIIGGNSLASLSPLPARRRRAVGGPTEPRPAGGISKAEWFEASDDADAIRQVKERKLSIASEIWQGNRRVGEIQPSDS